LISSVKVLAAPTLTEADRGYQSTRHTVSSSQGIT